MNRRIAFCSLALLLSACLGPKPVVIRVDLRPPEQTGAPYTLVAEVRNQTAGQGELELEAKLTDRKTGKTFRAEKKIHLESHETTVAFVEIEAPPADYSADAKVQYPPG
jgi:hypothetical protein